MECTAPQQARGPEAAAGALSLDRPGGSGTETTTAPQPRVEEVPQGVAEHVETVNDNSQAKTGQERQPWRHLHELTPLPAEHPTQAGYTRRQTESQEA